MENKQKILDQMVRAYEGKVAELEKELADFALEYDLDLSLGDYGTGRTLLTAKDFEVSSEDSEPRHWSGKGIGEWLYSSETC